MTTERTKETILEKTKTPNDYRRLFLIADIPSAAICLTDMHHSADDDPPWRRKIISTSCNEAGEFLPPTLRPAGAYLKLYLTLTIQHHPRWTIEVFWPREGNRMMYDSTSPPHVRHLIEALALFRGDRATRQDIHTAPQINNQQELRR